jgi:EmrB/QacA subfamily drug resistance transporter
MTTAPPETTERGDDAVPPALSHRQILTVLSGLMVAMFLAALDQTIVATAITTIANDLRGLELQAWATTAYLITSTIATPLYGKLSDQYGRKPFFIFAIVVFVLGSLACTFATSMYMLAAFRALQGIGAGGVMSLALSIIADILAPRQRAKYQGYFLAVFSVSTVVGPVVGGALAGQESILGIAGWRWVFLVNVPIGAVALVVVSKVLKGRIGGGVRHRLDWLGALSLVVGLVPLLIVAEQGRNWGWGSVSSVVCYLLGVVGLVSFVMAERRIGDEALIPLRLFRSGVFSIVNAGGLLIGLAMFGAISMIPQFLQIVRGASPTESGLLLLPFMFGMMLFLIVSGQVTARTGRYKILPLLGTPLMVAGGLLYYFRLTADMPLWETDLYMVVFGAGLGMCMPVITLAAQNAVPARDIGVATSTTTTFRQLGGTLGVAVFFSLLFSTLPTKIAEAFRQAGTTPEFQAALRDPAVLADPANRPVLESLRGGGTDSAGALQDASFLHHIDPRLAHPFFVGFTESMAIVFLCSAGIAVIAFVVFLFMKEIPLRTHSGSQEAALEAALDGAPLPVSEPADPEAREFPARRREL